MSEQLFTLIKKFDAKFVDFRFTDTIGQRQHITVPISSVDPELLENGKMIDGSSIKGWQKIHQSDLAIVPDCNTAIIDPFFQDTTLAVVCNVVDPLTNLGYERDPRSLALRAEQYLKSTGIADTALFGPEPEFFIFDDVRWQTSINHSFVKLNCEEASWNSGELLEGGNTGHRPAIKGGYFPLPPVDSTHDMRAAMSTILESAGIVVEALHHEVAIGQNEIATRFNSLVKKADEVQFTKYVVQNVAHNYGKTATFMPKPLVGDNGSGMHCHQSLVKDGVNIFTGNEYAGLSQTALYYIGGIIRHARALNAFTNPTTNSYKRLVPGYEAPVLLAYSARNRSAAIRIPHINNPKGSRIEVRFPDPMANPYLAFAAMMMAGLDGIENKILPGDPIDKDLYDLPPAELVGIPTVCSSLREAVHYLETDHAFLLKGNVFTESTIESYIGLKNAEIAQMQVLVHPMEYELYYSL